MQGSLARPDLWYEAALLNRLMYKSKSQHHGSKHFKYLSEVFQLQPLIAREWLGRYIDIPKEIFVCTYTLALMLGFR